MSRMLVFEWASLNPVTSRWAREEPLSEEEKKGDFVTFLSTAVSKN